MLKISEFSHLAHISRRMLRYYDERGLLKPAYVDPSTGYRYYTLEQQSGRTRCLFSSATASDFRAPRYDEFLASSLQPFDTRGGSDVLSFYPSGAVDMGQGRSFLLPSSGRSSSTSVSRCTLDSPLPCSCLRSA